MNSSRPLLSRDTVLIDVVTGLSATYTIRCFELGFFVYLPNIKTWGMLSLGCGVLIDVFVAVTLCFYLQRLKAGYKTATTVITKLSIYAVSTGVVTSAVGLSILITYYFMPRNFIFMSLSFLLSKLYGISLLAALNTRRNIENNRTSLNRGSSERANADTLTAAPNRISRGSSARRFLGSSRRTTTLYESTAESQGGMLWRIPSMSPVPNFSMPLFEPVRYKDRGSSSTTLQDEPGSRFSAREFSAVMASSQEHDTLRESTVNIDVETAEPIPFPSFTQVSEAAQSISPGVSDVSALTSSDKLSALPPNMNSPNLNRSGRSPGHQSPRIFRQSMDPSRSWPNIATEAQGWSTGGRGMPRPNVSEVSIEQEARGAKSRSSLDSDRGSFSGVQSVRRAFRRLSRTSDPTAPSPAIRGSTGPDATDKEGVASDSASHSRSRAVSPIRILQQWSANLASRNHGGQHENEEPFIPIDPFHFNFRLVPSFLASLFGSSESKPEEPGHPLAVFYSAPDAESQPPQTPVGTCTQCLYPDCMHRLPTSTWSFFTDSLPRVIYLHLLLRLPSMYFSRVARIFEDAEVSRPDIQRMMEGCFGGASFYTDGPEDRNNRSRTATFGAATGNTGQPGRTDFAAQVDSGPQLPAYTFEEWPVPRVTPALRKFKHSWEDFIDSLLREWKTLNVVSALLLSAILTMFQVPDAAYDPVTRTAALLSLICAIMALSYGCMYIVRFGTMRSMYRASRWAEEARKTKTFIWWNVWVLLAMPAVWMSWSMILFVVSILSFVWRTGSIDDPHERDGLSPTGILGPRIAITTMFFIGMLYLIAIIRTLKSYGRVESIEERKGSRFYANHHRHHPRNNPSARPSGGVDDRREVDRGTVPSRRGRDAARGNNTVERTRGRSRSIRKGEDGDTKGTEKAPKETPIGLGLSGMDSVRGEMSSLVDLGSVRGLADNRKPA
ncbi:hypothetical protein VNI00_012551 [Paramarasmius palmivorus]|uniref:DUF6534 domain-containing protein n=1 Tax=Paramarasmius palmivorus TaxID=297713 RepID=A0AAW0C704_9AGAR